MKICIMEDSNTHYEVGYKYGPLLKKKGKKLDVCPGFPINNGRILFGKECMELYNQYYPEIV